MMTSTNNPLLQPEIGPDGIAREAPVIAYTEKIIEAEQLQVKKYIEENLSKIHDVERELANLSMEMKLTAGPKKAALEHMRKKIEVSTERIRVAKMKEGQARKAWEVATNAVQEEEAIKQKLCEDLNQLVQESSTSQFARLEDLKRRLEALNPSRASVSSPNDASPLVPVQNGTAQAVPATVPATGVVETVPNQANSGDTRVMKEQSQLSSQEGEGRGKKKVNFQGKGRGIGLVPKGRGSSTPGWTGAGFDVDGRS